MFVVVGIQATQNSALVKNGPRPVNLRTDLGALADLIEIAFVSSMDSNGRAAVREMRTMSGMPGIGFLGGLNNLMQGMGTGYVWIADGKLVGNVSVYPADGPGFDGRDWVIVNVAVHPDYQRRGIAHQLMQASMDMIAQRGGRRAMLQVDADNPTARNLYLRLGFMEERSWMTWRRNGTYTMPTPYDSDPRIHIVHRQPGEWQAEYKLAEYVRPPSMGGLGWLRPIHERQFRRTFLQQIGDWLSLRQRERLVIRSDDERELLARVSNMLRLKAMHDEVASARARLERASVPLVRGQGPSRGAGPLPAGGARNLACPRHKSAKWTSDPAREASARAPGMPARFG